jgi:hypothetical protein
LNRAKPALSESETIHLLKTFFVAGRDNSSDRVNGATNNVTYLLAYSRAPARNIKSDDRPGEHHARL